MTTGCCLIQTCLHRLLQFRGRSFSGFQCERGSVKHVLVHKIIFRSQILDNLKYTQKCYEQLEKLGTLVKLVGTGDTTSAANPGDKRLNILH